MATLVTGLGYIGAPLASRLLDRGERVVAIESFFSTPKESVAELVDAPGMRLVEGSIADPAVVEQAFGADRIDNVFHLAAQASARADAARLAVTQETNFTGSRLLLDACRRHGTARVVFPSSMRLYRTPLPAVISERSPIEPTDLVHLSQLYGEVLLDEHRRLDSGEWGTTKPAFTGVAARLGIVHGIGPVMKQDRRFLAVPQLFCLQAAHGEPLKVATGPASVLAFVHLVDAVEALLRCRDLPDAVHLVNVASEVRSVASVATAVQAAAKERGIVVDVQLDGSAPPDAPHSIESELADLTPSLRVEDSVGAILDHYLGADARRSDDRCASS